MCYCCSPSDAYSSTSTNTNNNTNETESDTKPWLSRMFTPNKSASEADDQTVGDFNAAKHFDLKNTKHDFNKPAGDKPASGGRKSKSGRKIR